ncbi:DUF3151 domain-containing protein [Corynebacterium lujinxingii]|uniref:DUF3151 domain-containing protein n=1 Tax=Corynebacterium lujinxingii TaxID=2763010 RepID=A0A7H0K018_9CORY|nr:DUF3151 domain-containing protein [Corynebacterium lujinxingii]MBC3179072.1 DUF3151 domain-containing protein [Corynebacterium lujinxingii]NNO11318.1 DUF3151 family protein [Corynebacterium lujinxingii]QNP90634.1 DUF3151 domain-containing protein [Corynebacterium lujinxingii]
MEINDMLAPKPVELPEDPAAGQDLLADDTALAHPDSPAVWAARAERELDTGDKLVAYAYARTGYHRSLDRLRANGWKGWGPVPSSHESNRGVLKAIAMLALTSKAIGDQDEYDRCRQMLSDADPASVEELLG